MNALRKLQRFAMAAFRRVAFVLAWVLCLVFYVAVLGPYSIVMRIGVSDLLEKRPDPRQPSYWHRLSPRRPHQDRPF